MRMVIQPSALPQAIYITSSDAKLESYTLHKDPLVYYMYIQYSVPSSLSLGLPFSGIEQVCVLWQSMSLFQQSRFIFSCMHLLHSLLCIYKIQTHQMNGKIASLYHIYMYGIYPELECIWELYTKQKPRPKAEVCVMVYISHIHSARW